MPRILSYLYDNRIQVQLLDEDLSLKTRNRIVYSRTVKVYDNVDNVITVNFRNSDQKAANITGKQFTFSITNADGNAAVWSSNVTISNASAALGQVTLYQANIANLSYDLYNYTISYTSGNLTLPAYTDDNWEAAGQLEIQRNIY